jgi:hypothetical protein
MPAISIALPKDILEAPADVREKVLKTLREALKLPPVMQVTHKGGDEHNIWMRNSDPKLADMEDDFYEYLHQSAAERMADVFAYLDLSLDGVDMEKAFTPEYDEFTYELLKSTSKRQAKKNAKHLLSDLIEASKGKREAFMKYVQEQNPMSKKELAAFNKLLKSKLPEYAKQVEAFMARAGYLGKVRGESEKQNLSTVGILIDRYPETIAAVKREATVLTHADYSKKASEGKKVTILPLTPLEARAVEHANHSAAAKVTEVDDRQADGIKQMVLRAQKERWTPQKLAQELFDLYGEQNRDWRRVAITELSMATNDAYLSGLEEGEQVVGMGAEGACKHCKQYVIGKQFTVLRKPPDKETHATDMKHVWAGKSNFGRRVAEFVPCVPMHPNCRCRWHRISRFYKTEESGKFVRKTTAELIQEERLRLGMGLDPNLPTP